MKKLQTEIEIDAPANKVWEVLTDFNNWQSWKPNVSNARGSADLGSKLSISMKCEGQKNEMTYHPVITYMEKPKLFRWRGKMLANFLFANDKVFELEETSNGTKLIHTEEFRGLLVPLFCKNINKGVIPILDSMNNALKDKLEANKE